MKDRHRSFFFYQIPMREVGLKFSQVSTRRILHSLIYKTKNQWSKNNTVQIVVVVRLLGRLARSPYSLMPSFTSIVMATASVQPAIATPPRFAIVIEGHSENSNNSLHSGRGGSYCSCSSSSTITVAGSRNLCGDAVVANEPGKQAFFCPCCRFCSILY